MRFALSAGARDSRRKTTRKMTHSGWSLKKLWRYEKSHSAFVKSRTSPFCVLSARTPVTKSFISGPNAPALPRAAPPIVPGMPASFSHPPYPRAPSARMSSMRFVPAQESTMPSEKLYRLPTMRTTSASSPASGTSTLLPPASTTSRIPLSFAHCTASRISSSLRALTTYLAGPPISKVVSGASGTFSLTFITLAYTKRRIFTRDLSHTQ